MAIYKRGSKERESMDNDSLLKMAEKIALTKGDGHLSIFRFTTGWKALFGIPNLDIDGRKEVSSLQSFDSLEETLENLIISELKE